MALCAAALALGACTSTPAPSGSPAGTAGSPTASPGAGSPVLTPPGESPSPACLTAVQTGLLPSDRLVNVEVATGLGADRITFLFGPGQSVAPMGELTPASPPFVQGASGLPLEVEGDRFVQITFRGMVLADESGTPTYDGPREFRPGGVTLRHLVLAEAFEGVIAWVAGFRGPGCLTLRREGMTVIVEIAHG